MGSGFFPSQDRALLDQKSGGTHRKQRGLGRSEGPGCPVDVSIDLDWFEETCYHHLLFGRTSLPKQKPKSIKRSLFAWQDHKFFKVVKGWTFLSCVTFHFCAGKTCTCLFWCAFETLGFPRNRVWQDFGAHFISFHGRLFNQDMCFEQAGMLIPLCSCRGSLYSDLESRDEPTATTWRWRIFEGRALEAWQIRGLRSLLFHTQNSTKSMQRLGLFFFKIRKAHITSKDNSVCPSLSGTSRIYYGIYCTSKVNWHHMQQHAHVPAWELLLYC